MIFGVASNSWGLPIDSSEYHKRAIQALVDTGSGLTSSGDVGITTAEIRDYQKNESFGSTTFFLGATPTAVSPEGQYRIVFGNVNTSYLKRQWWTEVSGKGGINTPSVWSRKVSDYSGDFVELIALQQKNGYTFEVRLLYDGFDRGRKEALSRLRLLLTNAEASGLFLAESEPKTSQVSLHKASVKKPSPKLPVNVTGKWEGPMTNSKGGKLPNSVLLLEQSDKGEISGSWYSGWKLSQVKRIRNTLQWKHLRMNKGCRDYHNTLKVAEDGLTAELSYNVHDRCSKPNRYTGKALLKKVSR